MSVFASYSKYYDLLYRDKDYSGEADYVARQLRRFGGDVRSVLELGCGTGAHANLLAARGFTVHGVDMSEGMLAAAEKRCAHGGNDGEPAVTFSIGDARSVRLGRTFDAVISLFHVFSYQTTDEDLDAAFATARAHLRPSGILFFDCWFRFYSYFGSIIQVLTFLKTFRFTTGKKHSKYGNTTNPPDNSTFHLLLSVNVVIEESFSSGIVFRPLFLGLLLF